MNHFVRSSVLWEPPHSKQVLFPLALSLAAAIAAPAQASASLNQTDMPVAADPEPSLVHSGEAATGAIALNFEPPGSPVASASVPSAGGSPAPSAAASSNGDVSNADVSNTDAPAPAPTQTAPPRTTDVAVAPAPAQLNVYAGGAESLVARVVGAAEGTRSPNGDKTSLYEGHVDPGNGVWNRGTFSYQFGNAENLSAEEADRRQMAKIERIHKSVMQPKAEKYGLAPLTLAEELNGIDLINQAPLAVTESGGYIERLAAAKQQKGLRDREAILDARVNAFWDEDKGGWDAPGLRAYDDISKEASIRHDQKRRMGMIDQALAAYEQQHGAIAQAPPAASPQPRSQSSPPPATDSAATPERIASTPPPPVAHPDDVADWIIFNTASR